MNNFLNSLEMVFIEIVNFPLRMMKTLILFLSHKYSHEYSKIYKEYFHDLDLFALSNKLYKSGFSNPISFFIFFVTFITLITYHFISILGIPVKLAYFVDILNYNLNNYILMFLLSSLGLLITMFIITLVRCVIVIIYIKLYKIIRKKDTTNIPKIYLNNFRKPFFYILFTYCFTFPVIHLEFSLILIFMGIIAHLDEFSEYRNLIIAIALVFHTIISVYLYKIFVFFKNIHQINIYKSSISKSISFILIAIRSLIHFPIILALVMFISTPFKMFFTDILISQIVYDEVKSKYEYSNEPCNLCDFTSFYNEKEFPNMNHLDILKRSENIENKILYHNILGTIYYCEAYNDLYCPTKSRVNSDIYNSSTYILFDIKSMWQSKYVFCDVKMDLIQTRINELNKRIQKTTPRVFQEYFLRASAREFNRSYNELQKDELSVKLKLSCIDKVK